MIRLRIIVEVRLNDEHGPRPIGIMTLGQALKLPDIPNLEFTHPEPAIAKLGQFVSKRELEEFAARGRTAVAATIKGIRNIPQTEEN
jgi:hypothetical protein